MSATPATTFGSKPPGKVQGGERTDGPNFNVRKETIEQVLFAIRNGGFSGAIMPANIVTGHEATQVAQFVSKFAGEAAKPPPQPPGAGSQ